MMESEEHILENEPPVNIVGEVPVKKYNRTIEIALFIVMLSASLSGSVLSNIILYRTCMHSLHHTKEECVVFLSFDKNNDSQLLENEVQQYSTFVSTVRSIIESLAPAVLSMFLGVWSDTYGRKPLIVWPLFGMSISGILVVVYSLFDNVGPWWFILTVIPASLSGGVAIIFTGAFCYISDVTPPEKRSLRMTILQASVSAGSVVGSLLSAPILRAVNDVNLLIIGAVLNIVAYAYTHICMKESITGAIKGGLSTVLDISLVKEMVRECFKKRPNNGRAQILLLIVANTMSIFLLYGLMNLDYMYVRTKLSWSLRDYNLYSAINTTIAFVGGFLGIIVIQRFFRLSDLMLTNISLTSTLGDYIFKALAVSTWHMYLGASISLFKGLSSPLIRSLLTKMLPLEDIAKVFALMAAVEAVCPLISPIIFNVVYQSTISTLPSTVYIMGAGGIAVCIIFVGSVQFFTRNSMDSTHYERLEDDHSS